MNVQTTRYKLLNFFNSVRPRGWSDLCSLRSVCYKPCASSPTRAPHKSTRSMASVTLHYPPREEILRPFSVRENVLVLTPGPSNSAPSVLQISAHPTTSEDMEGIFRTMDELICGLQYVFQTKNTFTYAIGGTGIFYTFLSLFSAECNNCYFKLIC